MNTAAVPRPTPHAPRPTLIEIARDIKLSHSVFAMPFALLAMVLAAASVERTPSLAEVALIIVCMVLARTVAMTVNRYADARFDAANPRTAGRAIPAQRVAPRTMLATALACGLAFTATTAGFLLLRQNPWPLILSPFVLAWLAGYSYTKRFTALCHLYLGVALALSPIAATIAIEPAYLQQPTPWLLSLMVAGWVAGFDIIYALQDTAFDREHNLHSLPARLGVEPALWISRALHAVALTALFAAWRSDAHLGRLFFTAAVAATLLILLEHAVVWRDRHRRMPPAFMTINGVISLILGATGIGDALFT